MLNKRNHTRAGCPARAGVFQIGQILFERLKMNRMVSVRLVAVFLLSVALCSSSFGIGQIATEAVYNDEAVPAKEWSEDERELMDIWYAAAQGEKNGSGQTPSLSDLRTDLYAVMAPGGITSEEQEYLDLCDEYVLEGDLSVALGQSFAAYGEDAEDQGVVWLAEYNASWLLANAGVIGWEEPYWAAQSMTDEYSDAAENFSIAKDYFELAHTQYAIARNLLTSY